MIENSEAGRQVEAVTIPQSFQGIDIASAKSLSDKYVALMFSHEDSNNYRVLCDCGRQISKLYYDAKGNRAELGKHLYELGFPPFAVKLLKKLNNLGVFKNDDIWFSSYYLYTSCMNYSDYCFSFANDLVSSGVSNLLIANIGHKPYLENLGSKNVLYLIKTSLYIIYKCIHHCQDNLIYFNEEKVKRSIVELLRHPQANDVLRCLCLLILCHILQENDVGIFNENNDASVHLRNLSSFMEKAMKSTEHRFHSFSVNDFAYAFSHLSIVDLMKKHVCDSGSTSLLIDIFRDSSFGDLERQSSLLALWSLAMDEDSRDRLIQCGCVGVLLKFQRNTNSPRLLPYVTGVLRCLQDEHWHAEVIRPTDTAQPFVYISCHPINYDIFSKIHSQLQSKHILCRTSLTNAPSSADHVPPYPQLASDSRECFKSIAASSVVLMCISEAYKYNPLCRAEAEFASNLNKPVIPLCVVKRCRSDGWLVKVLGTTTSYDIAGSPDFLATCTSLVQHIQEVFQQQSEQRKDNQTVNGCDAQSNHVQEPTTPVREFFNVKLDSSTKGATKNASANGSLESCAKVISSEIQSWTADDVLNWLEENEMGALKNVFRSVNGRLLYQLSKIRSEAPDYFYKSLELKWGIDFLDILKLTDALDQL